MDSTAPPILHEPKPPLLSWITDPHLALLVPVVVYWSFSLVFVVVDHFELFEQYRLHPSEEMLKRNRCSRTEVLRSVILQHLIQTLTGLAINHFEPLQYTGHEAFEVWALASRYGLNMQLAAFIYHWVIPGFKIAVGFVIIDAWQYFMHRLMHMNKFLYKHLHSVHHRLYVPYSYGALYNSLTEGFLLDTLSGGLASIILALTPREAMVLYGFATMKTVDDHCGYELPFDPFQVLFPNNAVYHDIHHQIFGIKTNFSQPFFTIWDRLFQTEYKGVREYALKQRQLRLDKLREKTRKRD